MAARVVRACTALACVLLAACGGGGGGGGSADGGAGSPAGGDGGAPALILSADVFPLASGDRRSWRSAGPAGGGELRSERVGPAVSIEGRTAYAVMTDDGGIEYLERTPSAIVALPGPGADAFIQALGPVEILRFGIAAGQTVSLLDRTLSLDIDGNGTLDSVQVQVSSTFVGNSMLDTAAGRFADAAQVRTVARTRVWLTGATGSVSFTISADEWYAPGVGLVKSIVTTSGDTLPAETESEELVAYGVGLRRSETVAPALMSSLPATGAPLPPGTSLRLNFSETLDPLSLDGEAGLQVLDVADRPVAMTRALADDGRQVVLTPVVALAEGRYRVRSGNGVTDLANNPLPAISVDFDVDTSGPRLVSSAPAGEQADAPLTGTLTLRFDEPVFAPLGTVVYMRLHASDGSSEPLNVSVNGHEVSATLVKPLKRNQEYSFDLQTAMVDASGNPAAHFEPVRFRTDPGPLSRPQTLMAGAEVNTAALGDLDGDGRRDLVFVAQQLGTTRFFLGARMQQSDGSFAAPVDLHTLDICGGRSLATGDFDADGRADVVVSSNCGPHLTLLMRQPAGGFAAESPAPATASVYMAATLDLDSDGRSELLVADGNELRFLSRNPAGQWDTASAVAAGAEATFGQRLVDLDGDGRLDLVWLRSQTSNTGYEIAWALRSGSGFGPARSRALPWPVNTLPRFAVGDVNGDGRPDLVLTWSVFYYDGVLAVLHQDAGGGFGEPQMHPADANAEALATGDLDGDGRIDVVVGHSAARRIGVFLQGSDGTLQAERLFEANYDYYDMDSMLLADLDADGRLDIIAGNSVISGRPGPAAWPLQARHDGRAGRARSGAFTATDVTASRQRQVPRHRLLLPSAAAPLR